ncbi:hypothetical protein BDN72DRAFT_859913 [Pluteus cervinus]|uniref:Uncharacterized protein n=1 Tax=Pluteus cervinus TaxID=181527 RepID=A0ACD3ALG7_9AGAR|nr:hypothetical protein BDN72DRAFT_859913 [Pluteus cervinus]
MADRKARIHAAKISASKPLRRGKACGKCRELKIKCDGVKPECGPCLNRDDDCIYGDGPMTSKMKALIEENASLKADLLVFQNAAQYSASVTLHDPYPSLVPLEPISQPSPDHHQYELTPFSPSSTLSSLPSGSSGRAGAGTKKVLSEQRSTSSTGYEEPPYPIVQKLLDTFLPHSSQFGFFLDPNTFRESTLRVFTLGHHSRPTPALVTTVLLWGAHLSHSDPSASQEHTLLMRALRYAATDMSSDHPNKIIQTLQAEVLLSYYFLRMSRFLEAKIHSTTAITIALECGLNKIRSSSPGALPALGLVQDHPMVLHHTVGDKVEEGERINAFWSAFTLHKLLTVMLQPSQNLCGILELPSLQIDTPWPLDIESYQQEGLDPEMTGTATLVNFLQNTYPAAGGISRTAQFTKAAFLLHRAAYLSSRYSPSFQPQEYNNYRTACTAVHNVINNLRSELPPVHQPADAIDPSTRILLLTHALIDASMIKLHTPFAYNAETSKQICLKSAQSIITFGGAILQDVGALNPVMGYLWMTACQVLIDEISRIRHARNFYGSEDLNSNEEHYHEEWYRVGLAALNCFTEDNPLMRYHMSKTQEAFNAI